MKIKDKLEAKVLAGDAEELALLPSQLSLGDIWLILGAHRLLSSPSSSGTKRSCRVSPLRKSRLGHSIPLPSVTAELCIIWDDPLVNTP